MVLRLFLSVSVSAFFFVLNFANENGVVADNVNILPANSYPFSSSANVEIPRFAENNQSNYSSATRINFNVADKTYSATVGFVDNFFASQFGYTAIHSITPTNIYNQYMKQIKKQTAKMKKSLAVCADFPKALRGVTCSDYMKSPLRVDILEVAPQPLRSALSSKILKSFLNVRNFFSLSISLRSFLSAL